MKAVPKKLMGGLQMKSITIRNKRALTCMLVPLMLFTTGDTIVSATTINGGRDDTKIEAKDARRTNNFSDNKEEAKKWADNYYKPFNNALSVEQKNAIKSLESVEEYMLAHGSNTTNYENTTEGEENVKNINNLRKALEKNKGKILEDLVVYKTLDITDYLKMDTNDLFVGNTPNNPNINELKEKMVSGFFPALQKFELTNNGKSTESETGRVKLELTLPKGTNTGFFDSNSIFIEDSTAFEVDNIKVVTEKNIKFLKIEAHLISREKVQSVISENEQRANDLLNSAFGFPPTTKMITFHFEGLTSVYGSIKALEVIETFLENKNMPYDLKKQLMEYMLKNNKGYGIVFSDVFFKVLDQAQIPGFEFPEWFYTPSLSITKPNLPSYIFLRAPEKIEETNGLIRPNNLNEAFLHELGHIFDQMCGIGGNNYTEIFTGTVNQIFDTEKEDISFLGKNNVQDFWAEFFRYSYSTDQDIRQIYQELNNFVKMKELFNSLLEGFETP